MAIATIATNMAANVVRRANDFANCAPRLIRFKTGGVITDVVGVLIMPWNLLASPHAYIFICLVGCGGLLGPISGITVVGYWLVRRKATRRARPVQHAWPLRRHRPGGHVGTARWRGPDIIGFLCSVKLMGGDPDLCDTIYPYS